MPTKELTIAIVGSGGDGVVTAGDMIAQAGAAEGLNVIKTEAYGPQIRGGESSCAVRIGSEPIYTQSDFVDVLVAFNWADYARFRDILVPRDGTIVLHHPSDPVPEAVASIDGLVFVECPMTSIARDAASPAAKNIVMLGAITGLLDLPGETLRKAIERKFGRKKPELAESNLKAFDAGMVWATEGEAAARGRCEAKRLEYERGNPKLLMSGNEASAIGALHAGCRFFAGYPITPSSEVLQLLSEWMPRVGGSVIQTEDELSAMGAVIGGSFAGVKSMTATSGPGLSLMSELLGLATMAEIPVVIINVQRGGPSTGLPTLTEQSDLWHALFGGHGDAPRVVLACSDVEDSFHTTVTAFNIAEEYQMPVIVLSDQAIGQRKETLDIDTLEHEVRDRLHPSASDLEKGYERYADTANGVSPMSVPGMVGGMYQTNGLEHDALGNPASSFKVHERMNEKRFRKLRPIRDEYHFVRRYGPEDAEVGVLCWGSSKGAVKEAVLRANARGEKVAALVPQVLFPFPRKEFDDFVSSVGELVVIELSYSAQFYKYLRTFIDLPEDRLHLFKRSGGKNLAVGEVEEEIEKALRARREKEVVA